MAACERRSVSCDEKQKIVCLHQKGKTNSVIATTVGRSRSVVQRIVARFKSSGSSDAKPKTGAEISRELSSASDVNVSCKTVSRRLSGSGLLAWASAKKSLDRRRVVADSF
ncbi:uncharacterized protein LOC115218944 [Octopus sinensis]|uniref:Uncharacterized protein LOC115218944 n=1 Tax=Octopus sinensis TaxID=2607531 RepID=A0A6P7T357_9MOLL|nr:uncharacterized protein LOC115218944 [Octopus sinensis]